MNEKEKREFIMTRLNKEKKQMIKLSEEELMKLVEELDMIREESVEEGRYLDADNAKKKNKRSQYSIR